MQKYPLILVIIQLLWSAPSTGPELSGYRLNWGPASGQYTESLDVGDTTEHPLEIQNPTSRTYIAVTAYNEHGESDYSNETVYPSLVLNIRREGSGVALWWLSMNGETYDVWNSEDCLVWSILAQGIPAGPTGTAYFTDSEIEMTRFYYIQIVEGE